MRDCPGRVVAVQAAGRPCRAQVSPLIQGGLVGSPNSAVSTLLSCTRACYGVLRFIMESGAKGCEVIVSGKLRAQRAKAMKFKDGFMVSSGHPVNEYIDAAVRHVMLRQGVLGIKVWLYFCSPFSMPTANLKSMSRCNDLHNQCHPGAAGEDNEGMGPDREAGS